MYAYIYVDRCICIHVDIYMYICVCLYKHLYVYMYTCLRYVYIDEI